MDKKHYAKNLAKNFYLYQLGAMGIKNNKIKEMDLNKQEIKIVYVQKQYNKQHAQKAIHSVKKNNKRIAKMHKNHAPAKIN